MKAVPIDPGESLPYRHVKERVYPTVKSKTVVEKPEKPSKFPDFTEFDRHPLTPSYSDIGDSSTNESGYTLPIVAHRNGSLPNGQIESQSQKTKKF
jgi:hypothetical protein